MANTKMERANRVAVQATEAGFVARFYRTHRYLGCIESANSEWKPNEDANKTQAREDFRTFAIDHAGEIGVEFSDKQEAQAWDRKYQTYENEEQISEDASTLLMPTILQLAEKCKYDVEVESVSLIDVEPMDTDLSYIEDGRYATSGAWAWATLPMTISLTNGLEVEYAMLLKSGQICKPKLTIAGFEEMVKTEADLSDVELVDLKAQAKAEKEKSKKATKKTKKNVA